MQNKGIPIVLICDDGYVIPTCVAISSIISSKNIDTYYDIYIVCASLSEESEAGFLSLGSDTVAIHIIREDANRFSDLHVFVEKAWCVATASALLKFVLPDLLPQYDKVLYLDGDILVRTDLNDLYSVDLGDNFLAAVIDSGKLYTNRKIALSIKNYFNAGVMLLNLKQMRAEGIVDTLIQTKKESTDSNLMDQNVFNIVCEHRVKCLPVWYNFLAINLKRSYAHWTIDKINELYGTDFNTKEDLFSAWKIVHFSSKDKPWKNPFVMFADDWFNAYRSLPEAIVRTIPDFPNVLANNTTISMTSYPARIGFVPKVIDCLNNQSVRPTRVVLYLAKEQFKGESADLPEKLLKYANEGKVEIHWCDLDLKSHKKYYYAMQEYPDDIIITVDDDVYLPNNAIKELMICWLHNPKSISARRTNLITFDNNGKILPYSSWIREYDILQDIPSMQLIGTGCSGILYPPHLLSSALFDVQAIKENGLNADDLWLKAHEAMQNIPTVSATRNPDLRLIENSQEFALWRENDHNGGNDSALQKISYYIDKLYGGENLLEKALYSSSVGIKLTGQEPLTKFLKEVIKEARCNEEKIKNLNIDFVKVKEKLNASLVRESSLKKSVSFRIGRVITWLPRKVRGGVRCYEQHGVAYTLKRIWWHIHPK